MAILNARQIRPAVAALALGATLFVAVGHADAAPHAAPVQTPSVGDVQKALGKLAYQNTQLVEQYNEARISAAKAQKTAAATALKAKALTATYETARAQFVTIVQSEYQGGSSLGAAGALLESSSDSDYVDRVATLGMVSTHVSQVVTRIDTARATAKAAATSAAKLYAQAKAKSEGLATQRKTINARIATYKKTLQTLTSQQRNAYLRSTTPSVSTSTLHLTKAGSAAAAKAVAFALAQVGKPYVFGAAGPGSFDCSGLTMRAWQAGGVSLPHSAAGQYSYGSHVSVSDLEPGDLIFMYQPIGHVTIYIGSGMMVSAPTEGQNVTVVPVSSYGSDIVGATRLT